MATTFFTLKSPKGGHISLTQHSAVDGLRLQLTMFADDGVELPLSHTSCLSLSKDQARELVREMQRFVDGEDIR